MRVKKGRGGDSGGVVRCELARFVTGEKKGTLSICSKRGANKGGRINGSERSDRGGQGGWKAQNTIEKKNEEKSDKEESKGEGRKTLGRERRVSMVGGKGEGGKEITEGGGQGTDRECDGKGSDGG